MIDRGEPKRLWRVGHHTAPLAFAPSELYEYSHRFDDLHRRFRTLYCAELPETALREVLADFRPNLAARRRFIERYGVGAAGDLVAEPVTSAWRRQHMLAPLTLKTDGEVLDLTDVEVRQLIERRHVDLLVDHDLSHLDLREITTSKRAVTQTIAADLYTRGYAGVRFPSRLDGSPCFALFEGRGTPVPAAEPVVLTDPPPLALQAVCAAWALSLEAAPALPTDSG